MIKKIAALTLLAFIASPVVAQLLVSIPADQVKWVTAHVEDDNSATALESPAIWVKYIGGEESGTVDINVNAFEFFSGPLGAEVINGSAGFDVNTGDVCGTTNDSLDVTDTECDTPAELVNVINDSGAPWVAVLAGVLGTETLATAAEYIDPADAQAKLPGGFQIRLENAGVDALAILVRPDAGSSDAPVNANNFGQGDIEFFLSRGVSSLSPGVVNSYRQDLKENPFGGKRVALTFAIANLDSTLAWTLEVYAVRYTADGRRTERLAYSTIDTVDVTDEILDFSRAPLVSGPDETFLIRASDDALVTGNISYSAVFIPAR